MQRVLDILLSVVAILILSPVFLVIAIILRLTGENEVLYIQNRVGLGGQVFGVYKFATMLKNSPNIGTGFLTTKGDPRVLPFGRLLRKTKLNEFPQLFNILRGDMSFVGPRPQVPKHFDLYRDEVKAQLNTVRPGLTGVGSVVFRDEEEIMERNSQMTHDECYALLIAPYKGQLELWYIANRSIRLYLLLIILTFWIVLFPRSKGYLRLFRDLPSPPETLII